MPVNDTTANRSYQKPNIANTLSDDVGRLRSALDAIDTDMASKAPSAGPTFTGVTTVAAGSAAAPSLTFTGATSDTGLYSPGADQVAISTGGTGRVFVASDGKIGIGASSPVTALQVVGAGTFGNGVGGRLQVTTDSNLGYIDALDNTSTNWQPLIQRGTQLEFHTNTAGVTPVERVRITSDGKVGIGSSSPSQTLHVEDTNLANPSLTWGASATQTIRVSAIRELALGVTGAAPYDCYLQARNNANTAQALLLNPVGGNVGIGTSNPIRKLSVSNGGAEGIEFGPGLTSNVNYEIHYNRSTAAYITKQTEAAQHIFNSATGEVARIDSSGRLLVGTSTARTNFFNVGNTASLQVEGTSSNTATISIVSNDNVNGNVPVLLLGKTRGTIGNNTIVQNNDLIGFLTFQAADGTDLVETARIEAQIDGTPGANDMPGRLVFSTTADGAASPTERMRITSDGKVGIGSSSPVALLQPNGTVSITGGSGASSANGLHLFFDTATNSGTITAFHSGVDNRNLALDGKTIGFTIAGTERARIDSSGRLLVGTSSSSAAAKLVVQGITTDGNSLGLAQLQVGTTSPADGTTLGRLDFSDSAGTQGAWISCERDGGTWTSGSSSPGRLAFSTTANGAATPTERMRISQDGAVKIAGDNFQIATSKTPASATAAGTTGQIAWDANYIYVCTATNTWKRTAIATW